MSAIQNLVGKRITNITYDTSITYQINKTDKALIESPTTIVFEDYTLVIYNPYVVKDDTSLSLIENLVLISCIELSNEVILAFENKIELTIDLRDESYIGPEALSLHGPDNLIVVWN